MDTRNVTATITCPDGTLATGVVCTFTILEGTYTATEVIPPKVVSVTTHATLGTLTQELYCPASYRFAITGYPKETRKFTLPDGTSDIALTSLFASAASTTTGDSIQIAIDARLDTLTIDDLADVTTGTPDTGDVLTWNGSAWVADAAAGGGVTAHAALTQLDYASSGHTGFASSAALTTETTDRQAADTTLQADINTRALSSALTSHTSNTSNPHSVTAAQVGALTQTTGDARYPLSSTLSETIDDRIAALLVQGSNITLTYDDTANTLTIAASGGASALTWNVIGSGANPTFENGYGNVGTGYSLAYAVDPTFVYVSGWIWRSAGVPAGGTTIFTIPGITVSARQDIMCTGTTTPSVIRAVASGSDLAIQYWTGGQQLFIDNVRFVRNRG